MPSPRISVVIPARNAAEFIGRALRSAALQTLPPFEVIVADDGSTDATAEIAEGFGEPVRVLRLPHRGQSAATNAAVAAASGELIAPLHADDEWVPGTLAAQAQALERMPGAGLAYCDLWLVDRAGSVLGRFLGNKRHAAEGWVFAPLLQQCFVLPSAAVIRRSLFTEHGLSFREDLEYVLDYDFFLRAARICPFVKLDEPLVRRTVHEGAVSARLDVLHREHVTVMRRLREELVSQDAADASILGILDARLAREEIAFALESYRRGDVAEARRLCFASLRRRPSRRAGILWVLTLSGRRMRNAVAAARGWRDRA